MRSRLIGSVLGAFVLFAAVPAAAPAGNTPTVTIRIEGESTTLLPRTRVTLSTAPVPGNNCPGNSVAGAIETATNGNWDRQAFTSTILGESHTFQNSDYWSPWVNNRYGNGICNDILDEGDDVVMLVDFSGPNYEPTIFPVELEGVPGAVEPGQPFDVRVIEYVTDGTPGTGTPTPVSGARIERGGADATTGSDGRATVTLTNSGQHELRAIKSPRARSALVPVCVGCAGVPGPAPAPAAGGPPPVPVIFGLPLGRRFPPALAPRLLRGTVTGGVRPLRSVRMRLYRYERGRCQHYSLYFERFRYTPCVVPYYWYSIGTRPDWSYLLPERLPAGFYRLEIETTDATGYLARRRSVFHVLPR